MIKFEVGKKYYARSVCDHESVFVFEVLHRTEKTIRLFYGNQVINKKISTDDDSEICFPLGKYSMALVLRASREFVK